MTLAGIAAEQIVGFLLVLARVGPLFVLAPVFSARAVPLQARLVIAAGIALALTPIATRGQTVPTDAMNLVVYGVKEALVGTAFAFSLSALVAAVQMGAGLIDTIVGFSFAGVVDPFTSITGGVLGQLYALFMAIIIVVTGGDQIMIAGLAGTYEVIPLGELPSSATFAQLALDGFARVFVFGLEVVAPVLVAMLVVDAALALVARAAPQLNVFAVGLPAKILVAFSVVIASLPFVSGHLRTELELTVQQTLVTLSGGG